MSKNSKITICTALDSGIYKSHGGGQTLVHYEWRTGPINLLRAIQTLHEHRQSMERGYGNIGHRGSWIEIDGVRLDRFDVSDTRALDDARRLIAHVQSGTYAEDLAARDAAIDGAIDRF